MAQITTWDEFEPINSRVLLVLNSHNIGDATAGAVWNELTRLAPVESIQVVADLAWSAWIEARQIPLSSVKLAVDRVGSPLEINYFLEQGDTLRWAEQSNIRLIVGSLPHNLYNEEVQHVFERRAALLLGNRGRLLAHTLPNRYVYLFDLTDLLDRMGRDLKVFAYDNSVRALVDDMRRLWDTQGRPPTADATTCDELLHIVSTRLGASILQYDEQSRVPLLSPSPSVGIGDFLTEIRAAYIRLADDYAGRWEATAIKDDALDLLRQLKPGE